jgi:hypothetical protein
LIQEEVVCLDNLPAKDFIETIDVDDGEDEVMVVNDEDAEIDVDGGEENEAVDEGGRNQRIFPPKKNSACLCAVLVLLPPKFC